MTSSHLLSLKSLRCISQGTLHPNNDHIGTRISVLGGSLQKFFIHTLLIEKNYTPMSAFFVSTTHLQYTRQEPLLSSYLHQYYTIIAQFMPYFLVVLDNVDFPRPNTIITTIIKVTNTFYLCSAFQCQVIKAIDRITLRCVQTVGKYTPNSAIHLVIERIGQKEGNRTCCLTCISVNPVFHGNIKMVLPTFYVTSKVQSERSTRAIPKESFFRNANNCFLYFHQFKY